MGRLREPDGQPFGRHPRGGLGLSVGSGDVGSTHAASLSVHLDGKPPVRPERGRPALVSRRPLQGACLSAPVATAWPAGSWLRAPGPVCLQAGGAGPRRCPRGGCRLGGARLPRPPLPCLPGSSGHRGAAQDTCPPAGQPGASVPARARARLAGGLPGALCHRPGVLRLPGPSSVRGPSQVCAWRAFPGQEAPGWEAGPAGWEGARRGGQGGSAGRRAAGWGLANASEAGLAATEPLVPEGPPAGKHEAPEGGAGLGLVGVVSCSVCVPPQRPVGREAWGRGGRSEVQGVGSSWASRGRLAVEGAAGGGASGPEEGVWGRDSVVPGPGLLSSAVAAVGRGWEAEAPCGLQRRAFAA